jgi:serine/threonine protein phosphatase PrpC
VAQIDQSNVASLTDVGRVRDHNEDTTLIIVPPEDAVRNTKGILAVVADGMGGFEAGEVASSTATDVFSKVYYSSEEPDPARAMRIAASAANAAVREIKAKRVGTTLVAAAVIGETAYVANVGDSRAYLVSPDGIRQVSADHSWVMDQVRAGNMTPAQAAISPRRNVLTRCIGSDAYVDADVYIEKLCDGCALVLCSDGLHGLVKNAEIARITQTSTPQRAAMALIELANHNGGHDNISVAILRRGETRGLETGFSTVKDTPHRKRGWVAGLILLAAVGSLIVAAQSSGWGANSMAAAGASSAATATQTKAPAAAQAIALDRDAIERMGSPEAFVTAADGDFWVVRGTGPERGSVIALAVSPTSPTQKLYGISGQWPSAIQDAAVVGSTLWVTGTDHHLYRTNLGGVGESRTAPASLKGERVGPIPADWVTEGRGSQLLVGQGRSMAVAALSADGGTILPHPRNVLLSDTYSDFVPTESTGGWVGLRKSMASQNLSVTVVALGADFKPFGAGPGARAVEANRLTSATGSPISFVSGTQGFGKRTLRWSLGGKGLAPNPADVPTSLPPIWLAPDRSGALWALAEVSTGYSLVLVPIK